MKSLTRLLALKCDAQRTAQKVKRIEAQMAVTCARIDVALADPTLSVSSRAVLLAAFADAKAGYVSALQTAHSQLGYLDRVFAQQRIATRILLSILSALTFLLRNRVDHRLR